MDLTRLVDAYNAAWNAQDVDRLLALMDKRAAYYDAFWMEYVSGRDLGQYLHDSFEDENLWYERVGDIIPVENGCVCNYSASDHAGDGPGEYLFSGAEVITMRDDRIVTVSDFYCNPTPSVLQEVSLHAARHHGETRQAESGLSALRALRFRRLLLDVILDQKTYLDAGLTQAGLAAQVGCSVEHLTQVITNEFGTNFHNFVDRYRINHARQLLRSNGARLEDLERVARDSGYQSAEELERAFRRITGETPAEYLRR